MKHLLIFWKEVEPLVKTRRVMLFLDYDGTLTPIVEEPPLAKLSPHGRKVLQGLARLEGVKTAIVSGRSLAEVKALIRIPGLIYVGNHGLELEGPKLDFIHPQALEAKKLIAKISDRLKMAFKSFSGTLVENKIFTLSVHYRKVREKKVAEAKKILFKALQPSLKASQILLGEGKKVWEIRPAIRWNKGTMVLWLYGRLLAQSSLERILPIYVGDDRTDEDAFRALKLVGIGVKVTPDEDTQSGAPYYLRSPKEVFDFLRRLKVLKSETLEHTLKG